MPHARVAYQTTYILIQFIFCIKIHVTTKKAICFVVRIYALENWIHSKAAKLD